MKYIFSILLLPFILLTGNDIQLKGKIIDAKTGAPVAYATIKAKNQNTVVLSGRDGSFTLSVPEKARQLICSAAGYGTVTVKIDRSVAEMVIKMEPEEQKLEEVVVSAYGIAAPDRAYEPALSKALSGRTAGIAITQSAKMRRRPSSNVSQYNTEDYDAITENRFLETSTNPLSTFAIDVDGASYSNVRRFLTNGQLPPSGSVRVEEMINYFHYNYPQPENNDPFSINTEAGVCPWNPGHQLVMIGLQGKKVPAENLPPSNLVFLIDVSGSMMDENKLPLVRSSMKLLAEQLREEDKVSIVVYAGNAGLVLPATSGSNKQKIKDAIESLEAGGSTAGGAGIQLAYKIARQNLFAKGNNRVILCTDGDFNVGASSDAEMEKLIEQERKSGIYLTVLGYGMGNYKDNKMQKLADKGNGNHAYIDNLSEAKKVLVNEFGGTLFTIAKDVKLQVEFNPAKVQAYRLIGYENRMLNKEDFNNDEKDAGEIGSGHTVTALYEIIPVGVKDKWIEKTDALKYQKKHTPVNRNTDEMMTIKFRYKAPDGDKSRLIEYPVKANLREESELSSNFRFAIAVAEFGMLVSDSEFKQASKYSHAAALAAGALDEDAEGYRREFIDLVKRADDLAHR
jgi:Ca-activated chloride channel family protein